MRPDDATVEGGTQKHCIACGSSDVSTRTVQEEFEYGAGSNPIRIRVRVPVHRCATCESEYSDADAEDIRHEAVCRYLGVLTPDEVRAIRSKLGLSRQRFADVTRIGVATLARWESGEVIQNAAMDAYLRLVARADIYHLLESGRLSDSRSTQVSANIQDRPSRFPTLASTGGLLVEVERARQFSLVGNAALGTVPCT